jgi:signal transduction histidine kinase
VAHRTYPTHANASFEQQALEDIVAAASHELRQPLQSILGWVRLAQSSTASADTLRRALANIERGAQLVSGIADDLLASTPFVGRGVRALVSVDIAVVVDESVESARPSALAAAVTLVATRPAEPVLVRGDRAGLQHVMLNLLANAIRATPPNGLVDVHVHRAEPTARVSVSDTGHGIAPEQLPNLFRPFSRRHESSRGLGVGLAIVRAWVELHGGTIRVESDGENRGARFIVTLPLETGPSSVDPAQRRRAVDRR